MSLQLWIADVLGTADVAQEKLATRPQAITGHGIAVPFPVVTPATYFEARGIPRGDPRMSEAINAAPIGIVPIGQLVAIQHSVKLARTLEYVDDPKAHPQGLVNPDTGTPTDLPIVVRAGGVSYVHDGHHRATAAWARGEANIRARIVDLDAATPKA